VGGTDGECDGEEEEEYTSLIFNNRNSGYQRGLYT